MLGNANGLDLNNDSLYRLSRMGGLGVTLARRIVAHRPIRRWADLEVMPGFDPELIENLRGSGAKLGVPKHVPKKATRESRRKTGPPSKAVVRQLRKTTKRSNDRMAQNLFSGRGIDREKT